MAATNNSEEIKSCRDKSANPTGAIVLIFLGIIFLFNSTGLVPWSMWAWVWGYWPILIILMGLKLLLGESAVFRMLMTVVTILVLAAVLANGLRLSGSPLFQQLGLDKLPIYSIFETLKVNRVND